MGIISVNKVMVGLSEMKVSNKQSDLLIARDVGTGVCIAIHDPIAYVGGLYHIMLPSAEIYPEMAMKKPQIFVDTGVPLFLRVLFDHGGVKERFVITIAGGADLLPRGKETFTIGKQNFMKLTEALKANNLIMHHYTVGGQVIRSLCLEIGTGKSWVDLQTPRGI